ncbi:MAG: OmpW family protein [Beijerinckiaceae bacterium]
MRSKVAALFGALMMCMSVGGYAGAADLSNADLTKRDNYDLPAKYTFYLHAGPAGVVLSEGASMTLAGFPVAGADIKVASQMTFVVEGGFYLTDNIAVSFTGGWPPRAQIHPAGTLANVGKLGIATYGPTALTVHYHFRGFGRFQPYIGLGPVILLGLRNQDRLISNMHLNHALGFAVQVGAEYMLNERWGLFADVKKAYLRSVATGFIGGLPVKAKVKLDPLVLHTGLVYRF